MGNREHTEQGMGNGEQGMGNGEQGTGNGEQGTHRTGNGEWGTGNTPNREWEMGNREHTEQGTGNTANREWGTTSVVTALSTKTLFTQYHQLRRSPQLLTILLLIPETLAKSSLDVNFCASRAVMILCANRSPIPGRVISSSIVAVLMFTGIIS
jgi:hypothetical protein